MTTYGQIYYAKEDFFGQAGGETDISLTSGLISAIYNMTTETQQQKITELELENDRSVFRELPGEKLFIITVDKRMDTSDADDMLDDLATRFNDQYGDMVMDGMILNDFEPTVDEVVEERLWYSTVPQSLNFIDIIGFLAMFAAFIYYPILLLNGQKTIIAPLQEAATQGINSVIIESIILGAAILTPLLIVMTLARYSNIEYLFRFAVEFIRRPTRGGYAEQLPSWFLLFPIAIMGAIAAIVQSGRGIQYALTIQPWLEFYEERVVSIQNPDQTLLWQGVHIFLFFYFLTWFVIFPLIIGLITGDVSKRWLKSSSTIIGYSSIVHLPAHIIAGTIYHELVGFHPEQPALFSVEARSLEYIFIVLLPTNLFLFMYFFYLATGLNQLVTKNKERFPIALVIGFFIIIGLQNVIIYLLFRSGMFYGSLF